MSASAADSPPPPAPPVPSAPGPRATALAQIFATACAATLARLTAPAFSSCFPTVASASPAALARLREDFSRGLGARWEAEYAEIAAGRAVVGRLNALDGVVAEARGRREAWVGERGAEDGPTP